MLRTLDPEAFNHIAAHPEVLPWLGYPAEITEPDFTRVVSNPANVCFLTSDRGGGYILEKKQPGLYYAHTLAMPEARGRAMYRLMLDGFARMFQATDCIEIVSMVPKGNDNAESWAKLAGFRDTFVRPLGAFLMGERVDAQFKSVTYGDWAQRDAECAHLGQLFHERLQASGAHQNHDEDPVHNCWVGATIAGAIQGNLIKAVGLYNRWACVAGYEEAEIISANPPLVNIGPAVIQLLNGAIDVLKVRPPAAKEPKCQQPH